MSVAKSAMAIRVGKRIASLMERGGYTPAFINKKLRLASSGAVANWTNGWCMPKPRHLVRLAAVLGVTVDDLLGTGPLPPLDEGAARE